MPSPPTATTVIRSQIDKTTQETVASASRDCSNERSAALRSPQRKFSMSGRILIRAIELFIASLCALVSTASAGDYRGASAGWPTYANGTYAAGYPANYASGAYYVARPVATTTSAGYAPSGTVYMPVTAAYANPTYFAAYGRSAAAYQPVSVGYAPTDGGYYAQAANYAPVTANYAPANSYAVTPAGINSGAEAAAYFGQPTPLNYVPPRVTYRPTYAAVPVYMYRPVTAYQPIAGQPVTCMQASTCNTCMPQAQRCGSCLSWLNPFNWFRHGSSCCGYSGCGAPPTTAYCGTGCGQPYYPTVVPVVPTVPVAPPMNIIPAQPGVSIPRAGVTIPPPPTVAPGGRTIISPIPAENPPSLAPRGGSMIQPAPGSTFSTPLPGGQTPLPGSFQTQPGFQQPGAPGTGGSMIIPSQPPIGGGQGSFGTGTNYPPATDPYNSTLTPANPGSGADGNKASPAPNSGSMQNGPNHSVFGSGYRGSAAQFDSNNAASDGVIRAPELQPALPRGVQSVPDPDVQESARPLNSVPNSSAPKLLDPRDKTASRDPRWAVVPAQWPTKAVSGQLSERPVAPTKVYQAAAPLSASPYASSQVSAADYDDLGWKTAAF